MIICIIIGFLIGNYFALKAVTNDIDRRISSYEKQKIDILVELGKVNNNLKYPLSIEDRQNYEKQQLELMIKKTVIESVITNLSNLKYCIKNGKLKAK